MAQAYAWMLPDNMHPWREGTMSEPTIAGHIELPIAFGSVEEVEELLTRLGRRSGLLVDTDHIHQSREARSDTESHGSAAAPLGRRRRAVCYVLDEADWYIATGQVSEYGGMICFLRG